MLVDVRVAVEVGVRVGVAVAVAVLVDVLVAVAVLVTVLVAVRVGVPVDVGVLVTVFVAVRVGVRVTVLVRVAVWVGGQGALLVQSSVVPTPGKLQQAASKSAEHGVGIPGVPPGSTHVPEPVQVATVSEQTAPVTKVAQQHAHVTAA